MLGSFVAQLCNIHTKRWKAIDDLYNIENSRSPGTPKAPSMDDLKRVFTEICLLSSRVCIFVDAINESTHSSQMLNVLLSLEHEVHGLKIMMSSTEEIIVPSDRSSLCSVMTIAMDNKEIGHDILLYVKYWLQTHERLRNLPTPLKSSIMAKLLSQADGS